MAFEPHFHADEEVFADIRCVIVSSRQQSRQVELRLVLTNQAVYWPGHKLGLFDSVTTERMPIAEVVSVSLRTESYQGRLAVGGIMFVCGVIVAILLKTAQSWDVGDMKNILVFGIPVCTWLIGFGLYIATQGGWRRTLVIASESREFRWAEPNTFGGTIKTQVSVAFQQVHDWAQRHGLRMESKPRE